MCTSILFLLFSTLHLLLICRACALQTKRLLEDEEMYQRACRTLVLSFRFEGKTVTRSTPMPARGETRALDIASAAMAVLAPHARKDR